MTRNVVTIRSFIIYSKQALLQSKFFYIICIRVSCVEITPTTEGFPQEEWRNPWLRQESINGFA